MKVRYLTNRKKVVKEFDNYKDSVNMLPRVGETLVGFGDSYEVTNVCYFYSIDGTVVDHINVTLMPELEAARQRYLEIANLQKAE